jgi:hypothetical protein
MVEKPSATVRKMLGVELNVEPSSLMDDFRWLEAVGYGEDVECFLALLNDRFTYIPGGLTIGSGDQPFHGHLSEEFVEQIATVAGLIEHIERHVAKRRS